MHFNLSRSLSRRGAAALALAVALIAAACAAPYGASQAAPAQAQAQGQPLMLNIAAPADNAQVAAPFGVQLDSDVPLGPPESGLHHVHLYYDQSTPDGPYDLVYGNTAQVSGLTPGTHTILASLRNANHSDAGPQAMITVNVTEGGAVSSAQSSGTPMDQGTAYGY